MARDAIALHIADLAAFARRLRTALLAETAPPGHLRLLNHLARAAGHANWQALRAEAPPPPEALAEPLDAARVERALRAFDAEGRMARWPSRTAIQGLCLWAIWSRLPARRDLSEPEVNALLKAQATFGDHALLRRSLIDHRLAERTADGRTYRRIEKAPPPEARALILRAGRAAAPPPPR